MTIIPRALQWTKPGHGTSANRRLAIFVTAPWQKESVSETVHNAEPNGRFSPRDQATNVWHGVAPCMMKINSISRYTMRRQRSENDDVMDNGCFACVRVQNVQHDVSGVILRVCVFAITYTSVSSPTGKHACTRTPHPVVLMYTLRAWVSRGKSISGTRRFQTFLRICCDAFHNTTCS